MLVLTRKNRESVVVGDPADGVERVLKVTVLEIYRDKVRLGFEVQGNVPVHRWEVWQRIHSDMRSEDRLPGRAAAYRGAKRIPRPPDPALEEFEGEPQARYFLPWSDLDGANGTSGSVTVRFVDRRMPAD